MEKWPGMAGLKGFAGAAGYAMVQDMDVSPVQENAVSADRMSGTTMENCCERCGGVRAVKVGTRWLCESCYAEAGSCCLEFGADDLWDFEETKPI
jgi:hypothetical protein